MIPRLAALSIAEISERIMFGCASRLLERFCIPRSRVRALRLRRDRLVVWRARLAADFVLDMTGLVGVHGRGLTRK